MRKAVFLALFFLLLGLPAAAAGVDVSAKAAVALDEATGRVLYSKNERLRLPMASTTKIMTGLLAVESGRLNDTVTVPAGALRVEGSSMGLVEGEQITLRDLTYGLMLESGNDAANVIADYLGGGSAEKFVKLMNAKARSLGLRDTHFVTPSGLDAREHYTSALDLARLGAYAMKNRTFAAIVSTYKIRVTYNGAKNGRLLVNHNRLLKSYAGAVGIKTGFTKKCGRCLVSCAKRGDESVVVCTLNDPRDWNDHRELFDMAFGLYHTDTILEGTLRFSEDVVGGVKSTVRATGPARVRALLKDGESDRLSMQVQLPRFVYAPVQKGQRLGSLVFRAGGEEVESVALMATRSVRAGGLLRRPSGKTSGGLLGWLWNRIFYGK